MEIGEVGQVKAQINVFKIDLIVWKCISEPVNYLITIRLKQT